MAAPTLQMLKVTSPSFAAAASPLAHNLDKLVFSDRSIQELTNINDINRHLHETVAKERSIDAELEQLLTRRVDLEKGMVALQASTSEMLAVVHTDSEALASNVAGTSALAERVSAKVRELDSAQGRVADALVRIHRIVDRTACVDGLRDAMSNGDLGRAAGCVSQFLALEEAGGGTGDGPQALEQREVLNEARRNLEEVVKERFAEAARRRDHADLLQYLRLFKPLRMQDTGLQAFRGYVQGLIAERTKSDYDALLDSLGGDASPDFVGALSALLRTVVAAVEENEAMLTDTFGRAALVSCVQAWHGQCDADGSKILQRFIAHKQLPRLAKDVERAPKAKPGGADAGIDPRLVESHLDELLLLAQSSEEYMHIIAAKLLAAESPAGGVASPGSPASPRGGSGGGDGDVRGGAFSAAVRELVSYYITLEEYYMEESVGKAIRIDEYVADSLTSSMVDDVFFILQKCSRRALASARVMAIAAVFSHSNILLTSSYKDALVSRLQGSAARLLQSASGGQERELGVLCASASSGQHVAPLNNADVSAGYVLKLRTQLEELVGELFPAPAERDKVKSVLADLGKTSSDFKSITAKALDQLCGGIMPRLRHVLDSVSGVSYELSEAEYAANEVADTWVQALLSGLDAALGWLQPLLTPNNYDNLFHLVLDKVVSRLEALMQAKRFNQLGGLQLDRDMRVLVAQLSEITTRTVRDKFARLNQMATILGLESAHEMLDYWGDNSGAITWRLTEADVRQVLCQRVDFDRHDVASLPL